MFAVTHLVSLFVHQVALIFSHNQRCTRSPRASSATPNASINNDSQPSNHEYMQKEAVIYRKSFLLPLNVFELLTIENASLCQLCASSFHASNVWCHDGIVKIAQNMLPRFSDVRKAVEYDIYSGYGNNMVFGSSRRAGTLITASARARCKLRHSGMAKERNRKLAVGGKPRLPY
jgi:hypothetical protein